MSKKQTGRHILLWTVIAALGAALWFGYGWLVRGSDLKTIDYAAFSPNYKQDAQSPWGRKAARYEGQLYYSHPAGGGIFRMNPDGSGEERVVPCGDIRKLQVTGEGIHYLGFVGSARKAGAENRPFRLMLWDWGTGQSRPHNLQKWDTDLWDFYVSAQGTVANVNLKENVAEGTLDAVLYCTAKESYVAASQLAMLRDFSVNRQQQVPGSAYPGLCEMAAYEDLVFSANSLGNIRYIIEYELAWGGFAVTDRQTDRVVLDTRPLRPYLSGPPAAHRTIDGFCPQGTLVHVENELMLMTDDLQDSLASVLLGEESAILLVTVQGERAYILAEQAAGERRQAVYEVDLNTFQYKKLYTCAAGGKLLWFDTAAPETVLCLDGEKLVTARGKQVRVFALEEGEYRLRHTLDVKQDVVHKTGKTDVAGDWLFVYRFNEKENRDELVEKLRIGPV
ncbi:MAG: hypothetical protein GXY67_09850 [Clostridiales bacterium]|nr:hypothetical protein [Clostridiales bacterium]